MAIRISIARKDIEELIHSILHPADMTSEDDDCINLTVDVWGGAGPDCRT